MKEIVGSEHVTELDKYLQLHHKPFAFTVNIDCARLVRDFHEDLEFRFSLGIESIARRVLSMTRGQPITAIGQDVVVSVAYFSILEIFYWYSSARSMGFMCAPHFRSA